MKVGLRINKNNTHLSDINKNQSLNKEISFSLDFPSEYKDIYAWVDTNEYSQRYDFEDFYEAYENLKRFIGPGVNIEFLNNYSMRDEDYRRAEKEPGPQRVRYLSNDGEDFRTFISNEGIEETSISPSLSSVLIPPKEEDSDLYMNIPEMDANILKQYMNRF